MINRIIVALGIAGIALACAGPTVAQTPDDVANPLTERPASSPTFPATADQTDGGNSFWVTSDYVFARFQRTNLPALVTTSPPGTSHATAGVLGSPDTGILFGGDANNKARSGFRLETGYWFDTERPLGVEAGFMMLESQSTLFAATSDTFPILARPYINAVTIAPSSIVVAFPGAGTGAASGAIDVRAHSGNLYEGHLDLTEKALDWGWGRLDALIGYRCYRYDEGLRIRQTISPNDPATFKPGTQIFSTDDFGTQNTFHGCDMGLRANVAWENLSLALLAKVAIGGINREVNIAGSQVTTAPGLTPVFQPGGLYALTSNIGSHSSDDFKALTELGATFSWQCSSNLRLRVGYTAFHLNGIARASDQIDLVVNNKLLPPANPALPGPTRPIFVLNPADIWINSMTFGVEFTY